MVRIYTKSRIDFSKLYQSISDYNRTSDTIAELFIFNSLDNIIRGVLDTTKWARLINNEDVEEIVADLIMVGFNKIIPKVNLTHSPCCVFLYIQRGLTFRISNFRKKYMNKLKSEDNSLLPLSDVINCKDFSEGLGLKEDRTYDKIAKYVYVEAIERTKGHTFTKYHPVLDYLVENNAEHLLLDKQLLRTLFDFKEFGLYKICNPFYDNLKRVLEEESNMSDVKVVSVDDIEIIDENIVEELIASESFSPDLHGEKAREIKRKMVRNWVENAYNLGKIILLAKKHYSKERQMFTEWLRKHLNLSYAHALDIAKVSTWEQETIVKLIDMGYTSSHIKKLQPLKYEFTINDFLDKDKHPVDVDTGVEVRPKDMTSNDVAAAVKIINKVEEEPLSKTEELCKIAKKINSFLGNIREEWEKHIVDVRPKDIDLSELSSTDLEEVLNLIDTLPEFGNDYIALMEDVKK